MSDPNVGVPDANVTYGANVRVRGPEVCPTCGGTRWLDREVRAWGIVVSSPCIDCCCLVCGASTDVIGGECGSCSDEADRYAVRRADR